MPNAVNDSTIVVSLSEGHQRTVPAGTVLSELVGGPGVLAARVNGTLRDLNARVYEDATVEPVRFDSEDGKEVYRHSSTHIMAQAVKELFPSAQLAIGPAIEGGFYYDFAFERPFTPEDLEKIEQRIGEILKASYRFER